MRNTDSVVSGNVISDDNVDFFQYRLPYLVPDSRSQILLTLLPAFLPLIFVGYFAAYSSGLVHLGPVDVIWNWLVFLTPLRVITYMASEGSTAPSAPATQAEKSEMMRRLLGLDTASGILGAATAATKRRMSSSLCFSGSSHSEKEHERGPAGLGNWDNSCYQNSVLQGLASLESVPRYLGDLPRGENQELTGPRSDRQTADSLRGLIEMLNDTSNAGKRIWTPAALKNMSSWTQQDAQEYFSRILDEVDKELKVKVSAMVQGFEKKAIPGQRVPLLGTSAGKNPLEGAIAQQVACTKCGYSDGLSMVPFNCLTVPLGRGWGFSLSECLSEYTKLEAIAGVVCGRCTLLKTQRLLMVLLARAESSAGAEKTVPIQTRLNAVNEALENDDYEEKTLVQKCSIPKTNHVQVTKSRQAVIARPPKALVIHFNRSLFDETTGEVRKNIAAVEFPAVFDLAPWCLGSSKDGEATDVDDGKEMGKATKSMLPMSPEYLAVRGPIYKLRAVVTHQGRHENGHYICFRQSQSLSAPDDKIDQRSQQWWRLSDDDVRPVSEEAVRGQGQVFMLFYTQTEGATPLDMEQDLNEALPQAISDGVRKDGIEQVVEADDAQDRPSDIFLRSGDLPPISSTMPSAPASTQPNVLLAVPEVDSDILDSGQEDDESGHDIVPYEDYHPTKPIIIPSRTDSRFGQSLKEHTARQDTQNMLMV